MAVINLQKAIRSLEKTPLILNTILKDVAQKDAERATDGPNGWSVLFILCHLRDFEAIFLERVQLTVETDVPNLLLVMNNEELALVHDYATQHISTVLADLVLLREQTLGYVRTLNESQLQRVGIHPLMGASTTLDFIVNIPLHDIDHTEQIIRALQGINREDNKG
jgi:uncharacterized damage-inducible protein DinB